MLTEAVDMTIWLACRVWVGCRASEANGDEDTGNDGDYCILFNVVEVEVEALEMKNLEFGGEGGCR
jgi:hypothetical protein